jgi:hypothetical protein
MQPVNHTSIFPEIVDAVEKISFMDEITNKGLTVTKQHANNKTWSVPIYAIPVFHKHVRCIKN